MNFRKVLLIVIDALSARVILPALKEGRLPCFSQLIERGVLREECTSVFPSITPAATASIVTGVYPTDHGIAGAFWFDEDEDRVAYYGDDFWVIINEGMDQFFNDFLVHLNHDDLRAETLYQRVERNGLTAAAINFMWFRGETWHDVDAPLLLKLFPGVSFAPRVLGPKVLGLADFASSKIPGSDKQLTGKGGIKRRYGFHDETTADYLMNLASADPFPDFTLAYFPNNDFESHDRGPTEALFAVENVDAHLSRFIEARGGLDKFLDEFAVFIIGDHSQCDLVPDAEERAIDLDDVLDEFHRAAAGQSWCDDDDLLICTNLRSCHVYLHDREPSRRDRVIERLLSDPRIDQVIWRDSSWGTFDADNAVDPREDVFHVESRERGRLTFHHAANDETPTGLDVYETEWVWSGDLRAIDATLTDDGQLQYDDYPNALERISTGFTQRSANLWVTAKSGYEFCIHETTVHDGGSHGALNRDDSTAPLIIAGLPDYVTVPQSPRTIDVAPLCLQALGLTDEAQQLIDQRITGSPH